jgi:hypothetical protein
MKWRNSIAQGTSALGKIQKRPRPERAAESADTGCNSDKAQYSNTPSLRVAGFEDEDDDEDEYEAPGEGEAY